MSRLITVWYRAKNEYSFDKNYYCSIFKIKKIFVRNNFIKGTTKNIILFTKKILSQLKIGKHISLNYEQLS